MLAQMTDKEYCQAKKVRVDKTSQHYVHVGTVLILLVDYIPTWVASQLWAYWCEIKWLSFDEETRLLPITGAQ